MRTCIQLIFLLAFSSTFAQSVNVRVSVGGRAVGTGTITDKRTISGLWVTNVNLSLALGGEKLSMQAVEEYRADGTPVRTVSNMSSGADTEKTLVQYGKQSVTITRTLNGKSSKKTVPLPKGSIRVPSVSWFNKVRPKIGTKVAYWSLDDATLKWSQDYDKYTSRTTIPVKGRMVTANLIESRNGKIWLDDKGRTLRMTIVESGLEILIEQA